MSVSKIEVLVWTFFFSLVAFSAVYIAIINIFEHLNKLSDVRISLDGVPACTLSVPAPVGECSEVFLKNEEGSGEDFILDGKDCSFGFGGDVRVVCERGGLPGYNYDKLKVSDAIKISEGVGV